LPAYQHLRQASAASGVNATIRDEP
jgi:hypothetical protein